jgi:UDP-glucose 4-epimerase
MSTIWITGARGFIGRHLADYLSREGHFVLGLGHGAWPEDQFRKWGVSFWLNGDIEAYNLKQLFSQSGCPEVIYHLTGGSAVGPSFISPLEDFSRTVDSTAHLLDWIRRNGLTSKTMCVSSAAVYGAGHYGPIKENTPLSPYSPYGHHKAIMEMLCQSYASNFGVKIALVRFFSIYGAGLEKQLLWDICCQLSTDPCTISLSGTGREIRDWIHISDGVRLLWQMKELCSGNAPIINGGTGIGTSVNDIVSLVCNAWGSSAVAKYSGKQRPGDPKSLVADMRSARKLGFHALKPLGEGVSEMVLWYKEYSKKWQSV